MPGRVTPAAALTLIAILAGCGSSPPATSSLSGQIVFSQPSYSCAGAAQFVYTAHLTDRIGGLTATLVFASKQAGGTEKSVDQEEIPVTNPAFDLLSSTGVDVSVLCVPPFGPGDYIMRIVRPSDSKVLAEGAFTIVR